VRQHVTRSSNISTARSGSLRRSTSIRPTQPTRPTRSKATRSSSNRRSRRRR
jgi:hypothetical protein